MYLICRVLMTYSTEMYISSAMLAFVLATQMTNIMSCVVIGKLSNLYHTAAKQDTSFFAVIE